MTSSDIRDPRIQEWLDRAITRVGDPEYKKNVLANAANDAVVAAVHADVARRRRLVSGRVPERSWDAVLAPQPTDALNAVKHHLDETPPECVFIALAGPRGRGKTTALAWGVAERGGLYVEAHTLVRLGTFDPVWQEMIDAHVLALDELGAEYMNDAYRASLYEVLNARFSNMRKTLIATNLDAQDFRQRYCPRPEDRLAERIAKGGIWVNLPGESMRRSWRDAASAPASGTRSPG